MSRLSRCRERITRTWRPEGLENGCKKNRRKRHVYGLPSKTWSKAKESKERGKRKQQDGKEKKGLSPVLRLLGRQRRTERLLLIFLRLLEQHNVQLKLRINPITIHPPTSTGITFCLAPPPSLPSISIFCVCIHIHYGIPYSGRKDHISYPWQEKRKLEDPNMLLYRAEWKFLSYHPKAEYPALPAPLPRNKSLIINGRSRQKSRCGIRS